MAVTTVNPSPGSGRCRSGTSTSNLSLAMSPRASLTFAAATTSKTLALQGCIHHGAHSLIVIYKQNSMGNWPFGGSHAVPPLHINWVLNYHFLNISML